MFLARLKLAQGDVAGAAAILAEADQVVRQQKFVHRMPEVAAAQVLVLLRQDPLLHEGNLAAAAHLAYAHELSISQARVHLAQGDTSAALAVLEPLRQQVEAKGWADERLKVMVLQAVAHYAHGDKDEAVLLLGDALALAQPGALETITYIAMVISRLLLIPLSQEFVKAGAPDASYFQTLGVLLRQAHDSIDPILAIVFCLGALMFYYLLYQSKLIPRWLSGWGLIAAMLWLVAGLLAMFRLIDPMSTIRNVFAPPIFLQEMVMAVWLIVKGFNPSVSVSTSAKANTNQVQMGTSR